MEILLDIIYKRQNQNAIDMVLNLIFTFTLFPRNQNLYLKIGVENVNHKKSMICKHSKKSFIDVRICHI